MLAVKVTVLKLWADDYYLIVIQSNFEKVRADVRKSSCKRGAFWYFWISGGFLGLYLGGGVCRKAAENAP